MRRDGKIWLIAPLMCVWPMVAIADGGEADKLVSECDAADLPHASLGCCLERVRVREETDPSPQLQTLEANLEQRESGRPVVRTRAGPPAAPRVVEAAPNPDAAGEAERGPDQSPPQAAQPDSAARSG